MKLSAGASPSFLDGGGEMGFLMRGCDWSKTSLGNPEFWPENLKITLGILLRTGIPMFLFWGNDYICFYNDASRPGLGNEKHPALGKPGSEIWPETWHEIQPVIETVISTGDAWQKENMPLLAKKNGKTEATWWRFSYSPVMNEFGITDGVLAVGTETTAQVLLQTTLQEEKEQLEFALDAGGFGAWNLDPVTNAFTCNNKTREIFGLPPDENIDLEQALNSIPEPDRARVKEAISKALLPGVGAYDIEYTVYNANTGKERTIKARGKTYFTKEGKPFHFSGTLQDITDERNYRKELEKLQQMVENTTDFMSMASLEGQIKYMNKAGRKLLGIFPDEDVSQYRIKDFYSNAQLQFRESTVIPALNEKKWFSGNVFIKHMKTGEEIPCFANYIIVPDPVSGEPISRGLTLRDLRPEIAAQKELEDSEKRFRNLVEVATVATAVYVGEEMRIQWANASMLRLWGKDSSVIGKTVREALPELEGQPFHDQLQEVYTTGKTYEGKEDRGDLVVEGKLQTFYFNFSYKALYDAEGKIYGILNMAMDVTEQVLAKRYLQESERNFINLIMHAPVGICLIRTDNLFIELVNDSYLSLVDKKREDFVNKNLLDALPEIKDQGFEELLRNVAKTGIAFHGNEQAVVLMRNGKQETIYVNFVYEPLELDGVMSRILVTVIDITPQVESRRKIEEAEERARLAIDAAALGTFEHNYLTKQLILSDRSFELFETTNGKTVFSFIENIHPNDLKIREEAHRKSKKTGMIEYEVRVIKKDKSIRWVAAQGKLYGNEKGEWIKVLGILQDVTERKALEGELERRVKQRTNELVTINNELQQFAYLASHDLQEPLRKIQVFAGLIPKELPQINEKAKDYLQKVIASANRMSTLINNLLEFSQLSNISTEFVTTDLNFILQSIKEDFELLIKEKKAVIEAMPLPVIKAIPLQINQLFYNLLSNSLKFSREGEPPQISIEVRRMTKEEAAQNHNLLHQLNYYHFQFIDNGIGFRQEAAERIFTIFQRLHAKDMFSGTGVGLALCKKIAINHKGDIYATSEEGEGSVFHVILPETQTGN